QRSPSLFSYFKQLFAQVTNPAIDPVREEVVMSLKVALGRHGDLLVDGPGEDGAGGLAAALERLCAAAVDAVDDGATILVISDRATGPGRVTIPTLLA